MSTLPLTGFRFAKPFSRENLLRCWARRGGRRIFASIFEGGVSGNSQLGGSRVSFGGIALRVSNAIGTGDNIGVPLRVSITTCKGASKVGDGATLLRE